jgi:DNA-binding transcriptional ArsR family regulator
MAAMTSHFVQPRFARVAAAIGDPTRARMLGALMDGASRPAGEIAQAAGVHASTASGHLARLVDEGLLSVQLQGRHRYYRVSDPDVASALEALSVLAERTEVDGRIGTRWQREPYRSMKLARTCYRHLAGELGVQLFQALVSRGRLSGSEAGYELTAAGRRWLEGIGMEAPPRGERFAYPCLDWSERRHHLAGRLATSLLEHFVARRWLARTPQSRALKLTPQGRRELVALF